MSTSPDITDWLHISPRTDSPTTSTQPTSEPSTSSPLCFQDLTASSRVNVPQPMEYNLNYFYDLSDIANSTPSLAQSGGSAAGEDFSREAISEGFNRHHRMVSLESTTRTLINTPSPLRSSHTLMSPSDTAGHPAEDRTVSSFSPPLITSPETKSFLNYFCDLVPSTPPLLQPISISDVSPIVRAENLQRVDDGVVKKTKKKKTVRRIKHFKEPSSFVERLCAAPQQTSFPVVFPNPGPPVTCPPLAPPPLMSPYRLPQRQANVADDAVISIAQPLENAVPSERLDVGFALDTTQNELETIEPLSPLTPLPSSPDSPKLPLKIIIRPKRKLIPNATPIRRSKRPRRNVAIVESPLSAYSTPASARSSPDYGPGEQNLVSVHSVRTFPDHIKISDNFSPPRFISSEVSHPGGVYNPPRSPLDLYTPRFVKGKGVEKVGLCPICIEPHARGGEHKKLWFAMKFSAFKCYHMQYAHGISASTGRPFSPPMDFRVVARQNAGKKEKLHIQQGKCHKCLKWVAVEGIKDMESKLAVREEMPPSLRPLRVLLSSVFFVSLYLVALVKASALTTAIAPNERVCFYADVDKAGEKIGVQSGGSFDIDFDIKDPNQKVILDGERERQGDYVLTANTVGEYAFCFENDMSTLTDKLVDFDIMVESEPRREPPAKAGQIAEHTSALEESVFRLNGLLMNIKRMQKFHHTQENRGFSIVKSTQNRLFWYAVIESIAVVGMAALQVYILQTFFTKTGRRYKV
ncbi:putative membrane protein C17A5.08 [Psilocybe cubensis]|uniref:Membrane protein C17A5.08 n=1 Tax=Psilocybe cubensis TaxID=181762 RepID=A0ACB8GJY0_PSICU|nr:putative membrane protein C17A5.08 [Psilocybe cubensis]KAH9475369.1 putative membrane protein C17A5.08 [Psilocybe cubensis]